LNDEDITALIERSQTIITDRKGVIAKSTNGGKDILPMKSKKQKDGYYFLIDFAGDGAIVTEIERNYKIDDRILKFITVKKRERPPAKALSKNCRSRGKRTQARVEGDTATEGRLSIR